MQRQPCPLADPSRKVHVLPRCKALNAAHHNLRAWTDFPYLPSINEKEGTLEGGANKEAEKRKSHDTATTVKSGLKSWNKKTVCAFLFVTTVASAGAFIQKKMPSMILQRRPYFKNSRQYYLVDFLVAVFSSLLTIT